MALRLVKGEAPRRGAAPGGSPAGPVRDPSVGRRVWTDGSRFGSSARERAGGDRGHPEVAGGGRGGRLEMVREGGGHVHAASSSGAPAAPRLGARLRPPASSCTRVRHAALATTADAGAPRQAGLGTPLGIKMAEASRVLFDMTASRLGEVTAYDPLDQRGGEGATHPTWQRRSARAEQARRRRWTALSSRGACRALAERNEEPGRRGRRPSTALLPPFVESALHTGIQICRALQRGRHRREARARMFVDRRCPPVRALRLGSVAELPRESRRTASRFDLVVELGRSRLYVATKALHAAWTVPLPTLRPGEVASRDHPALPRSEARPARRFSFVKGYVEGSRRS